MAEDTCSRMALIGISKPAISTMVSSRDKASRGLLAWAVVSEPSWPVFMACSISRASPPRTSPTIILSGRIRRAFFTKSRMVISPLPSILAGRDSRVTTCSCCSFSSAASSMVTMRSFSGIKEDRTFRVVVLPEPVPPETNILILAWIQALIKSAIFLSKVPKVMRLSTDKALVANLRIVIHGPIRERGGIIILTREPSSKRASTKGTDSSICLPIGDKIRSMIFITWLSSWNCISVSWRRPMRSTKIFFGPFTIISVTVGSFSKTSIGPSPSISSFRSETILDLSLTGTAKGFSSNTFST